MGCGRCSVSWLCLDFACSYSSETEVDQHAPSTRESEFMSAFWQFQRCGGPPVLISSRSLTRSGSTLNAARHYECTTSCMILGFHLAQSGSGLRSMVS